jgi:DNA-binding transcriptional ArsR family regulator
VSIEAEASEELDDELSVTFGALADPTRRAILARLAAGDATVNELAQPFAISLQAISRHLKVLERAGLISRSRDAQYRPCRLEAAPLRNASQWIEDHRAAWEERFDRLGRHLRELQAGPSTPDTGTDTKE